MGLSKRVGGIDRPAPAAERAPARARGGPGALRAMALALVAAAACLAPVSARAQDPVLSSGQTIYPGDLKFGLSTAVDLESDDLSAIGRFGYGFGRLDLEGRVGLAEERFFAGAGVDVSLVENPDIAVSIGVGAHRIELDQAGDVTGIDATLVMSTPISTKTDLYGSLDVDFEYPEQGASRFTRVHVVGGAEIRLTRGVDFVAEVGLGANDRSDHYVSAGLSVYVP